MIIAAIVLAMGSYPWLKELFKEKIETIVYLR